MKQSLKEETFNNEVISEHVRRLKMELNTALAANETLINANRQYEIKWRKISSLLEFYKSFYYKFIQHLTRGLQTKGKYSTDRTFCSTKNLKEKFNIELNSHPEQIPADQNELPGILDVDVDRPNFDALVQLPPQTRAQFISQLDFEQSKYFLLELAKSLETELNFQKINSSEYANAGPENTRKLSRGRSLSSPPNLIFAERDESIPVCGGQFNQEEGKRRFHLDNQ